MKGSQLRVLAVLIVLGALALTIGAQGSIATPTRKAEATISPQAALDWNLIAVNTVRAATPAKFQIEGTLYMSYVQAAVYDAVTTIKGRYVPYHATRADGAGRVAACRRRSRRVHDALVLLPGAGRVAGGHLHRLPQRHAGNALPAAAKQAGVAIGAAAAADLIAARWGDGRDAPVATPFGVAPQPPGTWVFAPPPSAQSAQTPWVGAMRPFVLESASQFRAPAPPALSSPEYAHGSQRSEDARVGDEHRPHRRPDGNRTVLERERDQSVQPGVPRRCDRSTSSTSSTPSDSSRWET